VEVEEGVTEEEAAVVMVEIIVEAAAVMAVAEIGTEVSNNQGVVIAKTVATTITSVTTGNVDKHRQRARKEAGAEMEAGVAAEAVKMELISHLFLMDPLHPSSFLKIDGSPSKTHLHWLLPRSKSREF
jgi:hypothetical protein